MRRPFVPVVAFPAISEKGRKTMKLIKETLSLPARYTVNADATKARDALVEVAQAVREILDASEQSLAASIGGELQREIKAVAAARLELAKPLNEAAKRLIELEKAHCEPLIAEKERLGRLVTAYQIEDRRRVEVEEQARRDALQRLESERRAALDLSQQAQGGSDAVADVQAQQRAFEAQEAAHEIMRAPSPVTVKGKGAVTKQKLCFRVLDIHALYQARPDLCRIEHNPSAIHAVCDPSRPIPGLQLWFEDKTSFRSA
jgi:hypothetical protein